MKSFCIKTNNKDIINYLLKNLDNSHCKDIYYINKKFKYYENVIIHYIGKNISNFTDILSDILTSCILFYYEPILVKRIINYNYFYFDEIDKKTIKEKCCNHIQNSENENYKLRKKEIKKQVLHYIDNNKSMILDGFVNFRLKKYLFTLDKVVDATVKEYVIEREYNEFISLLQMYINSKQPNCHLLHLIYINGESIILDEEKNTVNLEDNIFNAKYLSDISFYSNDYALNVLLTLLPERIELHLIGCKDEFIDTLQRIFNDRLFICTNCNICKTYNILNNAK